MSPCSNTILSLNSKARPESHKPFLSFVFQKLAKKRNTCFTLKLTEYGVFWAKIYLVIFLEHILSANCGLICQTLALWPLIRGDALSASYPICVSFRVILSQNSESSLSACRISSHQAWTRLCNQPQMAKDLFQDCCVKPVLTWACSAVCSGVWSDWSPGSANEEGSVCCSRQICLKRVSACWSLPGPVWLTADPPARYVNKAEPAAVAEAQRDRPACR